ncbi:MAG TPA: hypothetical protein VJ583_09835 [Nitrososphaeraceae archaeon]|jgi:hypothetical protein|nr:hypothetical protein [Nitrososphaeraceae archaeon]
MSDNEIIVINFLTKIDNTKFISVPENNQEHLSNFIGEKVLVTVRKRNSKDTIIEDRKNENQE